jgi:hypothetical protein
MPTCSRCLHNIGPFSFRSYSKQTGRCNRCDSEVEKAVIRFIDAFREFASDGVLTPGEWERLQRGAAADNLDLAEALAYARPDVVELIRRAVALAIKDAVVTPDEEKQLHYLMGILGAPQGLADEVRAVLAEYKAAQDARGGNLPVVRPSLSLGPGEVCHLETEAEYINTETKTLPRRRGLLLLTSQHLRFASAQISVLVEWKKVKGVAKDGDMIYLEITGRKGTGFYVVPNPVFAEAAISRLVELGREQPGARRTVRRAAEKAKRTPHEVLAVAPGAGPEEVAAAYREMAKLYHPDKVASLAPEFRELAETRMKEINAAYRELTR